MPVLVALVYLGNAAILVVLRPHRRPMDRLVFPVVWTVFGTLCVMKYTDAAEELTDPLQMLLSTLQLFQSVCAIWVFFRERQWRAADRSKNDALELDGDRELRTLLLVERCSFSNSSCSEEPDRSCSEVPVVETPAPLWPDEILCSGEVDTTDAVEDAAFWSILCPSSAPAAGAADSEEVNLLLQIPLPSSVTQQKKKPIRRHLARRTRK